MIRAAALAATFVLAFGLPEGCKRTSGRSADDPPVTAAPAIAPAASATTPPVWTPPDTPVPPTLPATSPDLVKARAAAQAGDSKKVRALLEKKVRAGKGTKEEATLVIDACVALRDKACAEAVKAKHPEADGT